MVFIKTRSGTQQNPADFWDFWNFFGRPGPISSAGSGVIISADGYIVTNHHVVDQADQIEVILTNKHSYKARIVGSDPNTDLALLKLEQVEGTRFEPVELGNSDDVRIGEWVLAVGNPLNLTSTVTAGIVSAKGRNINIVKSDFPIESFIQTDAAINPGNSGGALINHRGELIGINTAIASKTGAYSGYGFAIPVNIVRKVVEDLKEFGMIQHAVLGAEVVDIDDELGNKLPNDDYSGVFVYNILPNSAAQKAGIQDGDVILRIDQHSIQTKAEFLERLSLYRPGDRIEIQLRRGNSLKTLSATLTNRNGTTELVRNQSIRSGPLGCKITPLTRFDSQRLGIEGGFRVTDIRNGLIRNLRLPENFIIIHINNQRPRDAQHLIQMLESIRGRLIIDGIHPNGNRGRYSFYLY